MTFDDVEAIALKWPGVETATSYGTPALKVRKKLLARLREDGETLVMPGVNADERDMLIETQPNVFYFTDHYRDWPIVLIRLPKAALENTRIEIDARSERALEKIERRRPDGPIYRTTPEMNPGLRRGGLIRSFRKQRASLPIYPGRA